MVFLPRKFIAAAVLAVFALPSWAQSEAAGAGASAPAAVAAPATEVAKPAAARPGPHAQRGGPQQHHYRHHHRAMHGDPSAAGWQEQRAQHHAQLKEQLQLSPAQEGAWTEFTTAIEHAPSHARLGLEGMEQLTTPERIDRMRALRIQHAAEADRRGDAVKAFYAQLNPAQQKTLDAHHRAHRGAHPMMGAGHRGQAMPAAGDGQAQHNCTMMHGSGPRDGRGPRGARNAPAAAQ